MKLRLAIVFLAFAFAGASAFAESSSRGRLVVHLLDYLARDYPGAVGEDGKVISESEYKEQREFAEAAMNAGKDARIPAPLQQRLDRVFERIQAKAPPSEVTALARGVRHDTIAATGLRLAPEHWPSLKSGRALYDQRCAACHGAHGRGDGPAAAALDPHPANFIERQAISPFQAFNTVRLGVPGTAMAPFDALSDEQVWDLAFLVVSFRHAGETPAAAASGGAFGDSELELAATLADPELRARAGDAALVALRLHSDDSAGGGGSGPDGGGDPFARARSLLTDSLARFALGDRAGAQELAVRAYLEGVEPNEAKLASLSPRAVGRIEAEMGGVREAIGFGDQGRARSHAAAAGQAMDDAAALLRGSRGEAGLTFLISAAIVAREGFEAALILIALLGVVQATGARGAARWLHAGWISALALGGVAWVFSGWLMELGGASREILEGATSLFAVGVLLLMGFWLHSRTEVGRWKEFVDVRVKAVLADGRLAGLGVISFVAVFREAFETVLFLRAVWLEGGASEKLAMASGAGFALLVIIGLSWAIVRFSARVPIRTLFSASSAMMAALAVILTGKGLHALQESGWLGSTFSLWVPRVDLLGVYPSLETLLPQLAVLGLVAGLWVVGSRPARAG
jgi:high-affinity iron transporter